MSQPTPSDVLEATTCRQQQRVVFLRQASTRLHRLRVDILNHWDPPPRRWWQRWRKIPATDPLAAAHRAQVILANLHARLAVETARTASDLTSIHAACRTLEQHAAGCLTSPLHVDETVAEQHYAALSSAPISLEHTQHTIAEITSSTAALLALVVECLHDGVSSERCSSPIESPSQDAIEGARAHVVRIVRAQEERGLLTRADVHQLADTFDLRTPHTTAALEAEQELVAHLRPQSLSDVLDTVRRDRRHRGD
jgi:ribosomal protein L16 Arg81 hydroxylase